MAAVMISLILVGILVVISIVASIVDPYDDNSDYYWMDSDNESDN
jgi:hypothetical protein